MTDPAPVNRPLAFLAVAALFVGLAGLVTRLGPPPGRPSPPPPAGVAPYAFPLQPGPDLDAAVQVKRQALRQNPESFLDRTELAGLYLQKAREQDPAFYLLAEREARRSLQGMPKFNDGAKLVLAAVAEARHDFAASMKIADEVLAARPGDPEALAQKITVLLAVGDLREATAAADLLVSGTLNQAALNLRAQVRLAGGDLEGALGDLRRGLAMEQAGERRTSARSRALMGRALAASGRATLAEQAYREALKVDSGQPVAMAGLAGLLEARGETEEASRLYETLRARSPVWAVDLARVQPAGAEALLAEAEQSLRETLAGEPTGHRRDLARVLLARGGPERVEEALDLLRLDLQTRRDGPSLALYAEGLHRAGRPAEGLKAVREALDRGYRSRDLEILEADLRRSLQDDQPGEGPLPYEPDHS